MKPQEVNRYYRSKMEFERQTGMSRGTLRFWLQKGHICMESQQIVEKATGGVLKASVDDASIVARDTMTDAVYKIYKIIKDLISDSSELEHGGMRQFIEYNKKNCERFDKENPDFYKRWLREREDFVQ